MSLKINDYDKVLVNDGAGLRTDISMVYEKENQRIRLYGKSIDEFFDMLENYHRSVKIWFHNLKFDGAFWLSFLIYELGYSQGVEKISDGSREIGDDDIADDCRMLKRWELKPKEFVYNISEMGQWYTIRIATKYNVIEIRDSLKLLPFNLKKIGKSFFFISLSLFV